LESVASTLRDARIEIREHGRVIFADYAKIQDYRQRSHNWQQDNLNMKDEIEAWDKAEQLYRQNPGTVAPPRQRPVDKNAPSLPGINYYRLLWPPNWILMAVVSVRGIVNAFADRIKNDVARKWTKLILGFLPFLAHMVLYPVTQMPSRLAFEMSPPVDRRSTEESTTPVSDVPPAAAPKPSADAVTSKGKGPWQSLPNPSAQSGAQASVRTRGLPNALLNQSQRTRARSSITEDPQNTQSRSDTVNRDSGHLPR
jgi:hypothetical protein